MIDMLNIFEVLNVLERRESSVLRMRFGLTGIKKFSLAECAEELKVSRERVRQIEAKALKKLRHPERIKILFRDFSGESRGILLRVIFQIPPETIEHILSILDYLAIPKIDAQDLRLKIPISELELSVRASNCLREFGIHTIGRLIQLREEDLLKNKNLGKVTLREIKELLTKKGLTLGMK